MYRIYPLRALVLVSNLQEKVQGVGDNLPLGSAKRLRATASTFEVPAHDLLPALIENSSSLKR